MIFYPLRSMVPVSRFQPSTCLCRTNVSYLPSYFTHLYFILFISCKYFLSLLFLPRDKKLVGGQTTTGSGACGMDPPMVVRGVPAESATGTNLLCISRFDTRWHDHQPDTLSLHYYTIRDEGIPTSSLVDIVEPTSSRDV